jgi:cytoskeletal protein CcmA (bactofilin family)
MSSNNSSVGTNSVTSLPLTGSTITTNTVTSNPFSIYGANLTNGTISSSNHNGLTVTGSTEFHGPVSINGAELAQTLQQIQDRLAILIPDPAKLEKYETQQ